jgi:hypothetical protein
MIISWSYECQRKVFKNLQSGFHLLNFTYKVSNLLMLCESYIYVKWNGDIVSILKPINDSFNFISI